MLEYNSTIFTILKKFKEDKPDFIFFESEYESFSVAEFFNTVCGVANKLYDSGVKRGDIVAVSDYRDINTILYFFACQVIGAVAFMVNKNDNLDEIEKENDFKFSLRITEKRKVLKAKAFSGLKFSPLENSKETTIAISTSGSTGEKKVVLLSQYAFISDSIDTIDCGNYKENDVALAMLPLNHVFGLALLFTAVAFRFKVFVSENADIEYLLDCIEKYKVTRMNGVPTLFLKMVELKGKRDISSLNCAYIGGASQSLNQFLMIEKELGIKLIPVYGMSECIGISSGAYADDSSKNADSVGKPLNRNEVKLASDGEIMVKSPQLCNGYLKGELSLKDGYLLTGDLGSFDEDGYLHIIGRKKDIIIRNGLNISVSLVSKKISDSALFKDFAVIGIDDKKVGEAIALAVVLKDDLLKDYLLKGDQIIEDVNVQISCYLKKYEMPEKIKIVDKIPLLPNGKIDRIYLKSLFTE